jgi:hypothetical protein
MISKIILSKIPITKSKSNQIFINKMQIENNNTLSIKVTYFGGCKKHSFELYGFKETKNKIVLNLEHNTNGDTCKKIIRENLFFDLTPINNEYQKMRDINNDLFVLTLTNFDIEYRILG